MLNLTTINLVDDGFVFVSSGKCNPTTPALYRTIHCSIASAATAALITLNDCIISAATDRTSSPGLLRATPYRAVSIRQSVIDLLSFILLRSQSSRANRHGRMRASASTTPLRPPSPDFPPEDLRSTTEMKFQRRTCFHPVRPVILSCEKTSH
ncbi:solute carrier family 22 member 10-like isoform X1 [Anopheles sinensis]|uniref:Solute carrier family 22 member 10-like isoform X1 n=1 Tax=Anopheles sinensis TaxID=74873 RepID=A0A084W7Y1_ANOSI|nr:solute carrier family 22 member 10-like isoform X1 [Anopheles sinensis]